MIVLQRAKPFELLWLLPRLLLCEIASKHAHDPALFLSVVRPLLKESHEFFAHRERDLLSIDLRGHYALILSMINDLAKKVYTNLNLSLLDEYLPVLKEATIVKLHSLLSFVVTSRSLGKY